MVSNSVSTSRSAVIGTRAAAPSTALWQIARIVSSPFRATLHRGVFLRLETIDEKSIAKGFRDLKKQAPAPEDVEGEGVMKGQFLAAPVMIMSARRN